VTRTPASVLGVTHALSPGAPADIAVAAWSAPMTLTDTSGSARQGQRLDVLATVVDGRVIHVAEPRADQPGAVR
jgi:hypothetical protein